VEPAGGAPGELSVEHDLDLVRAAEIELIADRLLKPRPTCLGTVEHARVGQLNLPDRQPVAVAATLGPPA